MEDTKNLKRILFLFSEELSANGICAKAVIKELQKKGYEVECVSNKEINLVNEETVSGVRYSRIKPRLTYRLMIKKMHSEGMKVKLISTLGFVLNKLKLIMSIPTWPLISLSYTFRFYKKAKQIYEQRPYDMIITVYSQIDTLIAGYLIKNRYPNVKFSPYFLDSLSGGYGPKIFSSKWTIKRGMKWEKILLRHADLIIAMQSSKAHHIKYSMNQDYYEKIIFLDIPLLVNNQCSINNSNNNILSEGTINFVYVGSIPCHIRNPKYILEVFSRLNIGDCTFTIIGTNTCPDVFIKAVGISGKNKIRVLDPKPHNEIISILNQADFLVNIGNNLNTMVPSKIFEYMSFGKPIISTSSISDDPSKEYFKTYPLSVLIDEDWNKMDQNVSKVESFVNDNLNKIINVEGVQQVMYENTPKAFLDTINKIFKVGEI
jgi:glycosyltransferase involved in cell wall biosynthesis